MHYKVISRTTFKRACDLGLVGLGIVVMIYTTALTIYNWLHGSSAKPPGFCDDPSRRAALHAGLKLQ